MSKFKLESEERNTKHRNTETQKHNNFGVAGLSGQ